MPWKGTFWIVRYCWVCMGKINIFYNQKGHKRGLFDCMIDILITEQMGKK